MDAFGKKLEVCEVVFAVLVVVFDAVFVGVAVFRREDFAIKGPFVIGGLEAEVVGNPVAV